MASVHSSFVLSSVIFIFLLKLFHLQVFCFALEFLYFSLLIHIFIKLFVFLRRLGEVSLSLSLASKIFIGISHCNSFTPPLFAIPASGDGFTLSRGWKEEWEDREVLLRADWWGITFTGQSYGLWLQNVCSAAGHSKKKNSTRKPFPAVGWLAGRAEPSHCHSSNCPQEQVGHHRTQKWEGRMGAGRETNEWGGGIMGLEEIQPVKMVYARAYPTFSLSLFSPWTRAKPLAEVWGDL